MGPPDFAPAFRMVIVVCVLAGIALGFAVPWLWDVAIKPLLRIVVM
jgi:hypothetical protein